VDCWFSQFWGYFRLFSPGKVLRDEQRDRLLGEECFERDVEFCSQRFILNNHGEKEKERERDGWLLWLLCFPVGNIT
jgi:hypothetical protein